LPSNLGAYIGLLPFLGPFFFGSTQQQPSKFSATEISVSFFSFHPPFLPLLSPSLRPDAQCHGGSRHARSWVAAGGGLGGRASRQEGLQAVSVWFPPGVAPPAQLGRTSSQGGSPCQRSTVHGDAPSKQGCPCRGWVQHRVDLLDGEGAPSQATRGRVASDTEGVF
jgi:hypothetical protein